MQPCASPDCPGNNGPVFRTGDYCCEDCKIYDEEAEDFYLFLEGEDEFPL